MTRSVLLSIDAVDNRNVSAKRPKHGQSYFQQMRAQDVMNCISKGAGKMNWSLLYETEERLTWDRRREVWVTVDGHAYEYPKHEGS
jgi:hypothetical protein